MSNIRLPFTERPVTLSSQLGLGLLCVLLGLSLSCTRSPNQGARPVVQVNETTLSAEVFGKILANRLKNYDALFAKEETNVQRVKNDIINEFVTSVIMRDYAKNKGLPSPDKEVEEQVNRVRASYPDDISFRSALSEENISLDNWKDSLRQSIYEKMVFQDIASEVKDPSDEEVATYYKANKIQFERPAKVRLRQLVVEKEEDAKRLLARLRQGGTSIEKLAKDFSVAPEGKNGGDTGWIEKGALEVFDLAFKMSVGQRSDIIKSSYGFHIFEVIGKKNPSLLSLSDAKPKIIASLRAEKERAQFQTWLEKQVKVAKVQRDEPLIASIKVHTEH